MSNANNPSQVRDLLRLKEAAHFLNVSLTTLWRLSETDPTFPNKIKFSARMCFYRRSDLEQWMDGKEVA